MSETRRDTDDGKAACEKTRGRLSRCGVIDLVACVLLGLAVIGIAYSVCVGARRRANHQRVRNAPLGLRLATCEGISLCVARSTLSDAKAGTGLFLGDVAPVAPNVSLFAANQTFGVSWALDADGMDVGAYLAGYVGHTLYSLMNDADMEYPSVWTPESAKAALDLYESRKGAASLCSCAVRISLPAASIVGDDRGDILTSALEDDEVVPGHCFIAARHTLHEGDELTRHYGILRWVRFMLLDALGVNTMGRYDVGLFTGGNRKDDVMYRAVVWAAAQHGILAYGTRLEDAVVRPFEWGREHDATDGPLALPPRTPVIA